MTIAWVIPVSTVIVGGIGAAGIDQCVEGTGQLATHVLDGPHLGDLTGGGRPSRRFEVEHTEGDLVKGSTEIIEAALPGK